MEAPESNFMLSQSLNSNILSGWSNRHTGKREAINPLRRSFEPPTCFLTKDMKILDNINTLSLCELLA